MNDVSETKTHSHVRKMKSAKITNLRALYDLVRHT